MYNITKTIILTLIFTSFLAVCKAQYGPGWPGGNNYGVSNYGSSYNKPITLKTIDYFRNDTYKFKVTALNDSVEYVKSKIYSDTILNQTYLIKINKKIDKDLPGRETRIYAKETKMISRESYEQPIMEGMATDSCWLFKVFSGSINAYSPLYNVNFLNTYYLNAFQVGDGIIQKMDPKELEKIITNNSKAKNAFDKKNYLKAIIIYNESE